MSDTSNQDEPSIEEILASIRKIINEDDEGGDGKGVKVEEGRPEQVTAEPETGDETVAAIEPDDGDGGDGGDIAADDGDSDNDNDNDNDDDILELTEVVDDTADAEAEEAPDAEIDDGEGDDDEAAADEAAESNPQVEEDPLPDNDEKDEESDQADEVILAGDETGAEAPERDTEDLVAGATAAAASSAMARLAMSGRGRSDDLGSMPVGNQTLEGLVREMLRPMLKEWLDTHLPPLVERLVERELEKLGRDAERY